MRSNSSLSGLCGAVQPNITWAPRYICWVPFPFVKREDAPWSHYYVSLTEMLPCTNIPRWSPLNATLLYDNTLIEQVTYEEAEKVFQSQM